MGGVLRKRGKAVRGGAKRCLRHDSINLDRVPLYQIRGRIVTAGHCSSTRIGRMWRV
jgi:hypothetical protein